MEIMSFCYLSHKTFVFHKKSALSIPKRVLLLLSIVFMVVGIQNCLNGSCKQCLEIAPYELALKCAVSNLFH